MNQDILLMNWMEVVQMSSHLENSLRKLLKIEDKESYTLKELNKKRFLQIPYAGVVRWVEFERLREQYYAKKNQRTIIKHRSITKDELLEGDLLVVHDKSISQYAIVNEIDSQMKIKAKNLKDNPFVTMKIIETGELRNVDQALIEPIIVNYHHLKGLGAKFSLVDKAPRCEIGSLTLSSIVINKNNNRFTTGLSSINDWDLWIKSENLLKVNNEKLQPLEQFPYVGELHLLLRELDKHDYWYDLKELLK